MPHDVSSLLSEIQVLRRKLHFFEHHHKSCSIALPASPPVDDETESSAELQIIPFLVQSIEASKLRDTIPRWRQIANQILKDVGPEHWTERREHLGLHTDNEAAWLTTAIFGAPVQKSRRLNTSQLGAGIMISAQAYATVTKATQERADMFRQIHSFMELVLVSLCAVLEILDFPLDEINTTMKICLSDSEDINLRRLRRGALWVNRTIVDMFKAGIGHKGSELFFIYGVSTSKYSILADNTDSGPHFVQSLLEMKLEDSRASPRSEVPNFTPFFIPAYIKVLIGDGISLSQICRALGYGTQYVTESTRALCGQYRNLALENGSDSLNVPLLVTKKRKRSSTKNAIAKRRQRSSDSSAIVARRTTRNGQNSQEVNGTEACRFQQCQLISDYGSGDAFESEGNGDLYVAPPRSRQADSRYSSAERIRGSDTNDGTCSGESSTSQLPVAVASNVCGGTRLTYSAHTAHIGKRQHSLSQENEAEAQGEEDVGMNSDRLTDVESLEVENHMWAGCLPVHNTGRNAVSDPPDLGSMGWEPVFDPPDLGGMGWEPVFDPPDLGGLGWEPVFDAPDLGSMGWEPVFDAPEVSSTGLEPMDRTSRM